MIKIAPSILSADFAYLARDIEKISTADYVHVDVMDGLFVPNISIGIPVVKSIRPTTALPLDVHLMIERPVRYVEQFCDAGADIVTCHVEADTEENILLGVRLHMTGDDVRTGIAELLHIADRALDHQMDVQGQGGGGTNGLDHRNADGDVGHEQAVHHVHMDVVGGGDLFDVTGQVGKIRGQDGGGDLDHRAASFRAAPAAVRRHSMGYAGPAVRQTAQPIPPGEVGACGEPAGDRRLAVHNQFIIA